jgi:mono/diheme cytochrome c family protein
MIKRLIILLGVAVVVLGILMLFTYDTIKIDWNSFMKIQPSYKAMRDPLPVPPNSIPVEGAAFVPGMGAPVNPVLSDKISLARGEQFFKVNCIYCHGPLGLGNGVIGTFFKFKPANLTAPAVQNRSDGAIFLIISGGVAGRMPPLNENLLVRDRWDTVNYVRTLKK